MEQEDNLFLIDLDNLPEIEEKYWKIEPRFEYLEPLLEKIVLDFQTCEICLEELQTSAYQNFCNHYFHNDCYINFIKFTIQQEKNIQCPQYNCNKVVQLGKIGNLLNQDFNPNKHVLFVCSKLECPKKLQITQKGSILGTCRDCTYQTCTRCNREYHPGQSCEQFSQNYTFMACHNKKCQKKIPFNKNIHENKIQCYYCYYDHCLKCGFLYHGDTECEKVGMNSELFATLVQNSFRMCPGCLFWVEKNGGCNQMTCKCGLQFCYHCGQRYSGHKCPKVVY